MEHWFIYKHSSHRRKKVCSMPYKYQNCKYVEIICQIKKKYFYEDIYQDIYTIVSVNVACADICN